MEAVIRESVANHDFWEAELRDPSIAEKIGMNKDKLAAAFRSRR